MSDELVVLNANEQAMQMGGIGIGSSIFKARPANMELVQRTTRQEGAQPCKFRVVATNEHFEEITVVLLSVPQEQREKYDNNGTFSKANKVCFSLDNIQPHPRAKNPPALYCATCPDGDIRWKKWRETHLAADLPPCGMYYHLFLAERQTQTPYYLNVKGISVMPFKAAMETQMAGMFQKITADVKAKNKLRGYAYVPKTGTFVPIPGAQVSPAPLRLPNIYDISFTMYVTEKEKGGPPVIGCKNFRLMQDEDRAEFGALYLDFANRKEAAQDAVAVAAEEEAQQAAAAVSAPPAPAVVLPGPATVPTITTGINEGPLVGEVVGKDEPITI
jgi:hypothetical protein